MSEYIVIWRDSSDDFKHTLVKNDEIASSVSTDEWICLAAEIEYSEYGPTPEELEEDIKNLMEYGYELIAVIRAPVEYIF